MKNRNEIISTLNYAWDMLPKNNEVKDELEGVITQLENEWIDEFEKEEV